MSESRESLFATALAQFERGADLIGLPKDLRSILSQPKNEIIVNFPVRMNDGRSGCSAVTGSSTTTCSGPTRVGSDSTPWSTWTR